MVLFTVCAALGVAAYFSGVGVSQETPPPRTIPQPTRAQLRAAGLATLPLAPESKRVDIKAPTFSDPTTITNPLFPISNLRSVVFSGRIDGKPFHTETTLLAETRIIEWSPGQTVRARVSQYFAYVDGRVEEVALDYYAQADDGSVWYLGEEVNDYDPNGFVDSTLGSWLAGREGPPEMIMPAHPKVGDVHRAENIPAIAFEEVAIKNTGKTVNGPAGRVHGAVVARELHDDGTYSDKVFAPGYGEFFTGDKGELEALALAVPTDALKGPVPAELKRLSRAADRMLRAAVPGAGCRPRPGSGRRRGPGPRTGRGPVPPRLEAEMNRATRALRASIAKRAPARAGSAAIDVGQSALDLQLRYRPPAQIDLGRFRLWAEQTLVDAAAGDAGGVRGDVTTMEWIRDRFATQLSPANLTAVHAHLARLRESVADGNRDLKAARAEASRLRHPRAPGPVKPLD
jgi:hypothetical protein